MAGTTIMCRKSMLSRLIAVSGADGHAMTALGTPAGENGGSALGLHTSPEAMGL
jgi:hypothetical protein